MAWRVMRHILGYLTKQWVGKRFVYVQIAMFAWKSTPRSASTELLYSPHIPNRHHSFGLQNVHFLTSCNIIRAVLNALKFQENTLSLVKLHVYRLSTGIELWVLLQLPGHCCPKCLAKLSTLVSIDIIKYYQHRTISMPLIVYVTACFSSSGFSTI